MMSSLDQRILLRKGSTWTDYSIQLNDWSSPQTAVLTMDPADYLYVSSYLPFNHKFLKITAAANVAREPYIEVNDGAFWYPVADQLDHTSGMTTSGVLQFTRDREKSWSRAGNNKADIPVMSTAPTTVYDSYWMRLSFPAGAITFTLGFVGQCFASDADLYSEYPQLRNAGLRSAWESGKADWNDQHLLAACYIAKTLRQRNVIESSEQLLDIASLRSPAIHKAAHIIWSGLGAKNYAAEIAGAQKAFEDSLIMGTFQVDKNMDGVKSPAERRVSTRHMTRG